MRAVAHDGGGTAAVSGGRLASAAPRVKVRDLGGFIIDDIEEVGVATGGVSAG
jgi:hypothetical protein